MFTSGTTIVGEISGDARRQAVASLRGYAYQLYASALAWIGLQTDERLYLEVAEDYAIVSKDTMSAVQVRDTAKSGSLTLRSDGVIQTINSFVDLAKRNPGKALRLRYLTTSPIRLERDRDDRPAGAAGLEYWRRAAAGADLSPLRAVLRRLPLSEPAAAFIDSRSDVELRNDLLKRIHWDAGAADITGLRRELEGALHAIGEQAAGGFTAAETEHLVARVLVAVFDAVLRDQDRVLGRLDLLNITESVTHTSVPRLQVEALLLKAHGEDPGIGSVALWRGEDETPLPLLLAPRTDATAELAGRVKGCGLAFAVGATGMGKSLLARLTARHIGGLWRVADFAGLDASQTADLLVSLVSLQASKAFDGLILDDLNYLDSPKIATRLAQLRSALERRDRLCIVTAYRAPDARLRSELAVPAEAAQEVLSMTDVEVAALIADAGGEATRWTAPILLATAGGHPQLVQATIADLQRRAWPADELDRLDKLDWSTLDLAAQRTAARRRLVATAPEPARAFLNRLSLLVSTFRRPLALEVADLEPEIQNAGELLDRLTGPWIDQVGADRFRVSPLLSDAGLSSLSKAAQTKVHAAAAAALLMAERLDVQDAGAGLAHGLIARTRQPLTRLAFAIISAGSETRQKLAGWLLPLQALSTNRPIFPEDLLLSRLLRLAQVLLVAASDDGLDLTEKWGALLSEIAAEQDTKARRNFETLALAKTLFEKRMAGMPNWVAQLARLAELTRESPFQSAMDPNGKVFAPIPLYFTILSLGIKTVAGLESCFNQLHVLSPQNRDEILGRLIEQPEEIAHTVNHPWLAEADTGQLDGRANADTYLRLAARAMSWGHQDIAMRCHIARSIMLDEYADDEAAALAALAEAETLLGHHPLISRARAKIAFRRGRHGDVLDLAQQTHQDRNWADPIEEVFFCREVAISATEMGKISDALRWFQAALKAGGGVKSDSMRSMIIGLKADIALIEYRVGDHQRALRGIWDALIDAGPLNPADSLKIVYLHKCLSHACLWLNSQITGTRYDDKLVAPPGMCSNPEPPETIRSLPEPCLEGGHYLLAEADISLGGELGLDGELDALLGDRHIVTLECQRRLARLQYAVGSLDFDRLPALLEGALDASLVGVQHMQASKGQAPATPLVNGAFPRPGAGQRDKELTASFMNDAFCALDLITRLRSEPLLSERLGWLEAWSHEAGFSGPNYRSEPGSRHSQVLALWDRANQAAPLLAEDLFVTCLRMLEWAATSAFRRQILAELGPWAAARWATILDTQRFRLRNPTLTVPAIQTAISSPMADKDRLAAILSAARFAFGYNLPDSMLALMRPAGPA